MDIQAVKNLYKSKEDIFNISFIILIMILGIIIFKDNFNGLLTDKGRELLFPEAIINGKILYKDILCIYFPLAFLLNALWCKIFGANLNVILSFGWLNSTLMTVLLYLIAKEFIHKNISFLFAITFGIASTFNGTLFNYLLPYSYSFTYGITAFLAAVLFVIKFLKSENNIYIYLAYLLGGFALACKNEFCLFFFVLIFASFIMKPCSLKDNFANILLYSFFPLASLGFLFWQGLTLSELQDALGFMHRFFTTDSMIYHIKRTGALPCMLNFSLYIPVFIKLIIFYGCSYLIFKITKFHWLLFIPAIFASGYIANFTQVGLNTLFLPIIMSVFLIFKFKTIYENKPLCILIISALILNIRMFWALQLNIYGMLTAHILILALIVVLLSYLPENKYISNTELKKFVIFMMCVYLSYFTFFNYLQTTKNTTPLVTEKGTIYLPKAKAEAVDYAVKYIHQYTKPGQKIFVLPEGMAINYFADRELDYKMPMLDRLYYDAFDEDKILQNLKSADYEIIFVVIGYGLTNFGKPYLYDDNNPVMKYIKENYVMDWKTEYFDGKINNIMYCYVKPY